MSPLFLTGRIKSINFIMYLPSQHIYSLPTQKTKLSKITFLTSLPGLSSQDDINILSPLGHGFLVADATGARALSLICRDYTRPAADRLCNLRLTSQGYLSSLSAFCSLSQLEPIQPHSCRA